MLLKGNLKWVSRRREREKGELDETAERSTADAEGADEWAVVQVYREREFVPLSG
jgi:hypothetical protein